MSVLLGISTPLSTPSMIYSQPGSSLSANGGNKSDELVSPVPSQHDTGNK